MAAAVLNLSRERDSCLERVFNTLSQGVMVVDRDGNATAINRSALKIHGLNPHDRLHDQLAECGGLLEWFDADGQVLSREHSPITQALKGGMVKRRLLHGRNRRNGHSWRAIYSATPLFDDRGNIQAAVIMVQDVSDPNRAEAMIARLGSMIHFAAVPLISLTRDGIVHTWNAAAESLFGYSAAEIIGQHVAILGSCDDRHDKVDTIRCVREGGMVQNLETVRIAKDGRKIPVLLNIAPIKDEFGAVVGMSATVFEVARGNRVESELNEVNSRKENFVRKTCLRALQPFSAVRRAVYLVFSRMFAAGA